MIISYKKLFKLLIDRNIYIKDLADVAKISPATLSSFTVFTTKEDTWGITAFATAEEAVKALAESEDEG